MSAWLEHNAKTQGTCIPEHVSNTSCIAGLYIWRLEWKHTAALQHETWGPKHYIKKFHLYRVFFFFYFFHVIQVLGRDVDFPKSVLRKGNKNEENVGNHTGGLWKHTFLNISILFNKNVNVLVLIQQLILDMTLTARTTIYSSTDTTCLRLVWSANHRNFTLTHVTACSG